MSVYVYRCEVCGGEDEQEFPIGTARRMRACQCGGLQRLVIQSPHIAAAALPNKRAGVTAIDSTEKRWQRDMPAYKALRRDGLQPSQIDGSDELAARANDRLDIEHDTSMRRVEAEYGISRKDARGRMKEALSTLEAHPIIKKA